MSETLQFSYRGVTRDGVAAQGTVSAADQRAALTKLAGEGLIVTQIRQARQARRGGRERDLRPAERVLVLRQLALMLEAGVPLLEALDTVAQGMAALKGQRAFQAVIAALRRGDPLGQALEANVPGFPHYVYAMARVGEASGRIADVLKDAAEQMAYEDRLRREFANSLTYPAFLLAAGFASVGFIFTQVVPRFATMIGDDRENVPAMSRWVLSAGEFASANLPVVLIALGGIAAGVFAIVTNARIRRSAYVFAHRLPVVGEVLRSREVAAWARLTAFGLNNGVPILSATALARDAAPAGPFRAGLDRLEGDLRAGVTVDASLANHTPLEAMDISMLRAGQKSGALGAMFGFIADNYEARLKDRMKRLTSLLEPMAIAVISIIVGAVALSLVLALSSVYEGVV